MDGNSRDQSHAEAAESSIGEMTTSTPPRLIIGRDDFAMAVLRNLAELMDDCSSPVAYSKLSAEARQWWARFVLPAEQKTEKGLLEGILGD